MGPRLIRTSLACKIQTHCLLQTKAGANLNKLLVKTSLIHLQFRGIPSASWLGPPGGFISPPSSLLAVPSPYPVVSGRGDSTVVTAPPSQLWAKDTSDCERRTMSECLSWSAFYYSVWLLYMCVWSLYFLKHLAWFGMTRPKRRGLWLMPHCVSCYGRGWVARCDGHPAWPTASHRCLPGHKQRWNRAKGWMLPGDNLCFHQHRLTKWA